MIKVDERAVTVLGVAQMVACYLGVVEAVGSSPVTQTINFRAFRSPFTPSVTCPVM